MIPSPAELSEWLPDINAIARQAGDAIMRIYDGDDFGIQYKDDRSPVTHADFAADALIREALAALHPDIPVLSEEGPDFSFKERQSWGCYWLVDPLDGTKGFIQRNGFFSVNIALIVGHRAVMGVIYAPVRKVLYYAADGGGAFRQAEGAQPESLAVRTTPREPIVVVVSRAHINKPTLLLMEHFKDAQTVKVDSSLKFCMVAEGSADLYLRAGPTCEWDTAAGQCLVEQAGGALTDIDGKPFEYNRKESLLNPSFVVHTPAAPPWEAYVTHLRR